MANYQPDFEGMKKSYAHAKKGESINNTVPTDSLQNKDYLNKMLAEAKLKINLSRLKEAIVLLEDLKSEPFHHSDVFYLLGECYRRANKFDLALENLLEAMRYEQHSEYVWKSIGLVYLHTNKKVKACELLLRFAKTASNKQECEMIGDSVAKAGNYRAAEELYTLSLLTFEKSSSVHLKRAACRALSGDNKNILSEDIKRSIEVWSLSETELIQELDKILQCISSAKQFSIVKEFIASKLKEYF